MVGKLFNQYSMIGKRFGKYSMIAKRSAQYYMIGKRFAQYSIAGKLFGQYSMIGMGVVLKKNVKPFSLKTEDKPLTVNLYALKKFGFGELKKEIHQYILHETFPTTPILVNIIKEFELLSKNSGRPKYK